MRKVALQARRVQGKNVQIPVVQVDAQALFDELTQQDSKCWIIWMRYASGQHVRRHLAPQASDPIVPTSDHIAQKIG
eukprot:CAMPEP_0178447296 /NCGR_PEP_ID=MMETSP0689_2-20121128/41307_1 /TAXON_ID=160604 /ORGANISM="Amphidinium massartii, Strain CS-259" /LENGTH=76 /DNA_ID=CAMNT_0020072269 /DNA_START=230 /DNA_END=460 /DNA_ORIENTATION=+